MRLRLTSACVCLVVVSLIFAIPCFAKIDSKNIVGIWLLDDGSGTVARDSSGNGNDGKIVGAAWSDGKFNKALQFNGVDNHVDMLNVNNIPTESNPRSITAWFYSKTSAGSYKDSIGSIVQQADDTNGTGKLFCVAHYFTGGKETVGLWGNSQNVLGVDGEIKLNTWHYVAVTYDGKTVRVYVDGAEKMNGAPSINTSGAQKSNFYLARKNDTNYGGVFNGFIDEVGLFNKALTADEVKEIMTQGLDRAALGIAAVYSSGKLATTWGLLKNHGNL